MTSLRQCGPSWRRRASSASASIMATSCRPPREGLVLRNRPLRVAPRPLPREWPVPSGAYDPEAGAQAFRTWSSAPAFVEALGFDWVSVSEHHYSPRILTPSPIVSAASSRRACRRSRSRCSARSSRSQNPIRVAEELAMLDTLSPGAPRLRPAARHDQRIPQLRPQPGRGARAHRRGHGADPAGVGEPQPFGWQGRHFQYRTVSIWPRPLQQPHPTTYALGTSRESCDFAARHRIGSASRTARSS